MVSQKRLLLCVKFVLGKVWWSIIRGWSSTILVDQGRLSTVLGFLTLPLSSHILLCCSSQFSIPQVYYQLVIWLGDTKVFSTFELRKDRTCKYLCFPDTCYCRRTLREYLLLVSVGMCPITTGSITVHFFLISGRGYTTYISTIHSYTNNRSQLIVIFFYKAYNLNTAVKINVKKNSSG